jgi:hypothetical protein
VLSRVMTFEVGGISITSSMIRRLDAQISEVAISGDSFTPEGGVSSLDLARTVVSASGGADLAATTSLYSIATRIGKDYLWRWYGE